jgi:hypothetical protein
VAGQKAKKVKFNMEEHETPVKNVQSTSLLGISPWRDMLARPFKNGM